jgi:hypothetical protein
MFPGAKERYWKSLKMDDVIERVQEQLSDSKFPLILGAIQRQLVSRSLRRQFAEATRTVENSIINIRQEYQ